jgi:hypothetical protein
VVRVGGQILAIGGFTTDHEFDFVEARRVTGTGTWREVAPLPTARDNFGTAEVRGLVYTAGGFDLPENLMKVVETFNPGSGRWRTSLPLPQPRAALGAAALGGLLYVAGGVIPPEINGNFQVTDSMVVYDPRKNTWRSAAPMPTPRARVRLVASGGYLYAIGGENRAGLSATTVERYDPKSNRWRTMNPMRESRAAPCAVETKVAGRLVLVVVAGVEFAAGDPVDGRRTTEVFDIATGRWNLLDVLLPIVRGSHGCATEADGTVLAIGGGSGVGANLVFLANVDALSLEPDDLRQH